MRNRYSRRKVNFDQPDVPGGMLADQFTILGSGEPQLFTDLLIDISGGGGGGTLPGELPPPVPVLPPTEGGGPPAGMPALETWRPVPYWFAVDQPSAGADFVYKHEYDFPARLLLCYMRLVTSAVAGSRVMILTLRDTANSRKAAIYPNVSQAASITRDWQFCHNWPLAAGTHSYTGTLGLIIGWMPQVTILPNEFFGTELALNVLDAGDQISNVRLLMVREPMF